MYAFDLACSCNSESDYLRVDDGANQKLHLKGAEKPPLAQQSLFRSTGVSHHAVGYIIILSLTWLPTASKRNEKKNYINPSLFWASRGIL